MYEELANNFLKVSKSDLDASICLFEKGFYPQSLFFFQQSVEKATKSFGISVGLLKNKEQIRGLSHDTLAMFEKLVKKFLELLKKNSSDEIQKQYIDSFIKNLLDIIIKTNRTAEKEDIIKDIEGIETLMKLIYTAGLTSNDIRLVKSFSYLMEFSTLFSSINATTRYPDLEGNHIPSEYYNKDSILVKSFLHLSHIFTEVLNNLEKLKTDTSQIKNLLSDLP